MATTRLSVRISQRLRRRLGQRARSARKRESEVIREALEQYLDTPVKGQSAYDLAVRTGFLGAGKNLPPDLSTNKKYFEGFGR